MVTSNLLEAVHPLTLSNGVCTAKCTDDVWGTAEPQLVLAASARNADRLATPPLTQ